MKKAVLGISVLVFSTLSLAACGNNNEAISKSESSSSVAPSSKTEESTSATIENANQVNLDQAAKQLESKFNTDSEKIVKVEVQNDVIDDTADVPHSVIEVRVINDEDRKSLIAAQDAIDSNTATDEQRTQIYGIQANVEKVAKTLDNENDTIQFIVSDTNGNNIAIALANKTENIIPLVM